MELKLEDIFNNISTDLRTDDMASDVEIASLLAKSTVPYSHRRIANQFYILKNLFDFQVVQPRISGTEKNKLSKYGFNTLENTTIKKANKEIAQLKEWATSTEDVVREESVELLNIRVKELKYMLSYHYTTDTDEVLNGYKAYDAYLTNIPRYYN